MLFSESVIELIKERSSWRTYNLELLDKEKKGKLKELLKLNDIKSPFDTEKEKCRFELINVSEFDPNEQKKLGTYGMISGAREFIVGATYKSHYYKENFGYLLEMIILKATEFGLGTCWLGGTFNRTVFSEKIKCKEGEVVPAITPVGFPAKRRIKEKIIRRLVKAKKRKDWSKLFFINDLETPLSNKNLGKFETVLEMVRLAPSAGNKQPWRIIKEENSDDYHLYVKYPEVRHALYRPFVKLDAGIATCHFDLSAKALGLGGKFKIKDPGFDSPDLDYIISWKSH